LHKTSLRFVLKSIRLHLLPTYENTWQKFVPAVLHISLLVSLLKKHNLKIAIRLLKLPVRKQIILFCMRTVKINVLTALLGIGTDGIYLRTADIYGCTDRIYGRTGKIYVRTDRIYVRTDRIYVRTGSISVV
jgi:hypothetical protein